MTSRSECKVCAYAAIHACWPKDHRGTHCRDCHRSWTGLKEAHCVTCHEHFSTDAHAESHRGSRGACVHPASVLRKDGEARMRLTDRGSGPVWVGAERMDVGRFAGASA